VLAVLETLLARERGVAPNGRPGVDLPQARQILDSTDATIRQAKDRVLNWTDDEPALIEIILRDAAQAVASADDRAEAGERRVVEVIQNVLAERAQGAHQLIRELQDSFSRTLEALRQAAPLADADPAAIRDLAAGGLPAPDPSPLRGKYQGSLPWWRALFPPGVAWAVRRALDQDLASALREYMSLYDRQLHAWLKNAFAQLIDAYEAQAEVFREQVRRLTGAGEGMAATLDAQALAQDIEELRRSQGAREVDTRNSPERCPEYTP
jgi:hypothetical protein